ncbi:MAG: tRNA-modifying protein YgfZ [Candidatus Omnitrophica bacterium]|nr:tRNA-modifying protein YgfZ [Candidatus Omnitrophota bacterium]
MSDIAAEVQAARQRAGLAQRFPRALLAIRGADRVRFLHNLVSHDIKGLQPGQDRPACLLDRQGKIRAAFLVQARPEELILEMDPAYRSVIRPLLEQYRITEAVEFEDLTDRYRNLLLIGPRSEAILAEIPSGTLFSRGRWNDFRIPAIQLWVDPEAEPPLRSRLMATGRPMGLAGISPEALEILRIEAGIPWPGREIDETVILNELGQEDWVSFTKGCFVGQEIVARIKYRAHPPRLLTGFLIQADAPPPPRSVIELDSHEVGVITSGCFSPTLNRVIALGFLKFGLPATGLLVRTPKGSFPAIVTPLPFV